MKIAIVGGGPSGLYLGILVKRRRPSWQVEVVEQNKADDTFGFGVVLAETGLAQLQEADETSYAALITAMRYNDRQIIVHKETPIAYDLHVKGGAITRLTLLRILNVEAEKAGVRVHYGRRLETTDGLAELNLGCGRGRRRRWHQFRRESSIRRPLWHKRIQPDQSLRLVRHREGLRLPRPRVP